MFLLWSNHVVKLPNFQFFCRDDFLLLAETCFKSFGDRVKYWTTINEPNMFAEMSYVRGFYPPAHCSPPFGNCSVGNANIEPLIVVHNMLLAHGKVVKLYRERYQVKELNSVYVSSLTLASWCLFLPKFDAATAKTRWFDRISCAFTYVWTTKRCRIRSSSRESGSGFYKWLVSNLNLKLY